MRLFSWKQCSFYFLDASLLALTSLNSLLPLSILPNPQRLTTRHAVWRSSHWKLRWKLVLKFLATQKDFQNPVTMAIIAKCEFEQTSF
ncbi:hypothetical protein PS1_035415 [Malus domestica]